MEFRLLGPVEMGDAGTPTEIGPTQRRHVLAALAVDAGRPVLPHTLVDRVWDEAPASARGALHAHVAKIRGQLRRAGPARLVRRSGGYALDVEPEWVDAHRFRRLIAHAGQVNSDHERVRLLRAALDLWRGEALAGLPGDWAGRTREGLHRQRVDAALAWAGASIRINRPATVISPLAELVEDSPWVEPLVGTLMRALCAVGRRAEAIHAYQRLRWRLADDLAIHPGPELRKLFRSISVGRLDDDGGVLGSDDRAVGQNLTEAECSVQRSQAQSVGHRRRAEQQK